MSEQLESSRPDPPRLRIHHFLLWIAVTAILLAFSRVWIDSYNRSRAQTVIAPIAISTAFYTILFAGQISIAILLVTWRRRGIVQRIEPGEWIAIVSAVDGLAIMANGIYFHVMINQFGVNWLGERYTWLAIPGSCLDVIWMGVFGALARSAREPLPWRFAYLLLALEKLASVSVIILLLIDVSPFIEALSIAHTWLFGAIYWLLATAIVVASVCDFAQQRSRRWTHWLGAMFYVIHAATAGSFEIWSYFHTRHAGWSAYPPL